MKIAIGGDHAGFQYKEVLKEHLITLGNEIIDFGPNNEDSCDYPDIAHPLAISVAKKECYLGIAICGSGNGISMALNKHQEIRTALCWKEELAELARLHNDANIIALPARFISIDEAISCVMKFINTEFEGGRHQRRVDKIAL
jgi:ribose 5-phosphate isomerase B